jgi:hypothetical protein
MKTAVLCLIFFIFAASVTRPAGAHTVIGQMLRDASTNHDLEKIRINLLKIQRQVDEEDHARTLDRIPSYHAQAAKPETSR